MIINMNNNFKDISWQVTEDEYRQDKAYSYSTLAKYEREGFNNLETLFDKVESPSLTFGSIVDTLITGSDEEFNERFMVADFGCIISDTLVTIVKRLFDNLKDKYVSIDDIPDETIIDLISDISWNNHWLPKTRAKKIKEDCKEYYKILYISGNRTIISPIIYQEAINTVDKLKSSSATKFYFEQNNIFDTNIERFYQLKFKATIDNIDFRCMADEIIVIHDKKIVIPIDLKTSSKPEWDFYKSFIDWRYDIQGRLYWRIIRDNMDRNPYFKDFKLANYRFIVANKKTLVPLVWIFNNTTTNGDLTILKDKVLRDPIVIAKELNEYLENKPLVPNSINITTPNNIEEWLNKL